MDGIISETAQRKRGREAAKAEVPEQPATEQPTRPKRERPRKERKPRVPQDLLTIAFRGPLANRFQELAERHRMSLARVLQDGLLLWESSVAAGYQPGTALSEWQGRQAQEGAGA